MRLLRHWGSDRQVLLGLDLVGMPPSSEYHLVSSTPSTVQRTTLQAKKHMTASGGPAVEELQGCTHRGLLDAPHSIESRCLVAHTCHQPPDGSVLTRHADAAVGGTPIILVGHSPRLTTMSTAFSQDFVQADRLIRRRYVQIPGKQKDLLERPDAWSENLSHGPRSMINVPPEVLQDVKDFHARRHSKPSQQTNFTRPPSSAGSSAPLRLSRPEQPVSSPRLGQDDRAGDDGATQLSWSPSPSRPPPGDRFVQPVEPPELVSPLRNQLASRSSLLKRKTPPISLGNGPPSSAAQSDGVPYEPLSALGEEPHPPVNRGANRVAATQSNLPAATPPSAQVELIPSTLGNTGRVASVAARPFNKRRRVGDMEVSDKEYETTEQGGPLHESGPKPRPGTTHDERNTSSASVSTPSLPSQAAVGQRRRSDILQATSAADSNEQSSSRYTPTYEGRPRGTPTQQKNVLRHTASGSSMAPAPAQPTAEPTHSNLVKVHQTHAENIVGHHTPYEEFKAAYPDYEESTRAFIRACLAVEKLELERALPEFLYDDFVRVHSTVYMDYYGEAQIRKYKEVLKATQWYNENVKDLVYTKKIIRRDNLPAILKAHSNAVRQIRESIRAAIEAPPSTDDAHSMQESDEDMADDNAEGQGEGSVPGEAESDDIPESRLSPEFHVSSPGPAEAARPAVIDHDDSDEVNETAKTPPASSRKRQDTEALKEGPVDGSPLQDMTAPEGFRGPRDVSRFNRQEPETVLDEEAPLEEVAHGIERTPHSRKSPKLSQSRHNAPPPANSTLKSGFSPGKLLAPLPPSSPSSVMASVKQPANDNTHGPTKNASRPHSPAFRSQAESSDDESDPFDPPVEKAVKPMSRPVHDNKPTFLTQAEAVYEIPGTPDRLSEEPMPPPPPQSVARTAAASQPRTVQGQAASTARTATAKQAEVNQRRIPERERVVSRSSIGSSVGARKSPASSNRSRASLDLFKPRAGETKEERSKRNREHIRKFLSKKTPGSTPGNTK